MRDAGNVNGIQDLTWNTLRDAGNVNGIRDLSATLGAGFSKIWTLIWEGKETIFGIAMKEVRDVGFSWKRSGNVGSESPFPGPHLIFTGFRWDCWSQAVIYRLHSCRTNVKKFIIFYRGPKIRNCLPVSITDLSREQNTRGFIKSYWISLAALL